MRQPTDAPDNGQQINVTLTPEHGSGVQLAIFCTCYAGFVLGLRPDLRQALVRRVEWHLERVRYRLAVRRAFLEIANLPEQPKGATNANSS